MKIDGISLDELMLGVALGQFKSVPCEAGIDYTFSREFQEQIHHTDKKSKSALWRFWQTPVKRAILITVLAAALLASVLLAYADVRHIVIDFFTGGEQGVHIPQVVETYYIPTYEPEGFTLIYADRYNYEVIYLWQRDNHEMIEYRQELIRDDTNGNKTNDETENRTTAIINGFSVDIISRGEGYPFTAQWTDGRYNYHVSIPSSVSAPYPIFEALVNSLIAVGATDCANNSTTVTTDTILIEEEDRYDLQFAEPMQYHTSLYSITVKDGKYILTPNIPLPDKDEPGCKALIYPTYTSIKEMRQGILEGPISQYELWSLVFPSQNADHSIEICDPNHLYEFTAPEEFNLKYIAWSGNSYDCHLTGDNGWGGIDCYNNEDYTKSFNQNYKDFLTNPLVTITEQRKTSDRFATVYYGHTDVAKLKYVCYELHVGDKTMYIQEEYLLEIEDDRAPVSSDVPSTIQFWGTQSGGYFHGIFFDFTERPSVKWLSQFGITPYEDSDTPLW